jgi:predicted nucleic-acid-binding protein
MGNSLRLILQRIKTIEEIHQTNFLGAFNIIDEIKNVLNNELFGVKCSEQINEKVVKLTIATKERLLNEFVQLLLTSKQQDEETLRNLFEVLIEKNHILAALSSFQKMIIAQTKKKIKQVLDECLALILQNSTSVMQGR